MDSLIPNLSPDFPPAGPLLSIVIVTFRSAGDIRNCLRSIPRTLFGRAVEIIVVDNASTDETEQAVLEVRPPVRFHQSGANLGFSKANNLGANLSSGEYILFLNPDTVVNEPALEACLKRVQADSGIGIISPRLLLSDGTMDLACRRSIPTAWDGFTRATGLAKIFPGVRLLAGYNLTYLPDEATYDVGAVNGAFMLLSRKNLARIGLFDERFFMYGDDLDLCYRCSRAGLRIVYDGRFSIIHLKGQSSAKVHRTMSREVFRGTKQFYLKHFNPRQSVLKRWKYELLFKCWESWARFIGNVRGRKMAQPM